jgi:hypothetical protein
MNSRYRTIEVEVDLADFDDDEIEQEFRDRGLGGPTSNEQLYAIYQAMRLGKTEHAHTLMWDYVRDRLGVAV